MIFYIVFLTVIPQYCEMIYSISNANVIITKINMDLFTSKLTFLYSFASIIKGFSLFFLSSRLNYIYVQNTCCHTSDDLSYSQ